MEKIFVMIAIFITTMCANYFTGTELSELKIKTNEQTVEYANESFEGTEIESKQEQQETEEPQETKEQQETKGLQEIKELQGTTEITNDESENSEGQPQVTEKIVTPQKEEQQVTNNTPVVTNVNAESSITTNSTEQEEKTKTNSDITKKTENTVRNETSKTTDTSKNQTQSEMPKDTIKSNQQESSKKADTTSVQKNTQKENTNTTSEQKNTQKQNTGTISKTENTQKESKTNFCIDGGTVHLLGSGPNEHGYYKTWDDAFSALKTYMKNMKSGNYCVDECDCGLFYFWVVER